MAKQENQELKYCRLMKELKEMILDGNHQAGDKLPSENELSAAYEVSRHTVRKALALLEQEGYVYAVHGKGTYCSELGRHPKTSRNIAVVTTYLSDYIFPAVIQGIDRVMTENGYSILLKNTKNSSSAEGRCLEELLQKDIEGLIIEPSKSEIFCRHLALYKKLEEYGIPYVFIQGNMEQLKNRPSVIMDDFKGGYLITEHLLSLGHRNILGMFKADDRQGMERHRGYVRALQQYGILYDPEKIIWFHTEDRAVKPFARLRSLVSQGACFDSVVCYNDQIAVKTIQTLSQLGLRVPEDISVTGYDNSFLAENYQVGLTTIAHPQEKLGEMAAELLLELMRAQDTRAAVRQIVIEPELIVRESGRQRSQTPDPVQPAIGTVR